MTILSACIKGKIAPSPSLSSLISFWKTSKKRKKNRKLTIFSFILRKRGENWKRENCVKVHFLFPPLPFSKEGERGDAESISILFVCPVSFSSSSKTPTKRSIGILSDFCFKYERKKLEKAFLNKNFCSFSKKLEILSSPASIFPFHFEKEEMSRQNEVTFSFYFLLISFWREEEKRTIAFFKFSLSLFHSLPIFLFFFISFSFSCGKWREYEIG